MSEIQSQDKVTTNGKKPNNADSTQPKQKRRTCGIPVVKSLSEMPEVRYTARIEQQPTEWGRIKNYDFYSPASDGSRMMQRITRSKSLDLKTRQTIPTDYGQGYLIHLEANPTVEKADF